MSSAVLDRILAIPDYDLDRPQMGLSNNSWAIVAATGKTKDGSPAKASVLKQERKGVSQEDIKKAAEKVGIKGDRKLDEVKPKIKFEELNPSIAAKAKKAIANLNPSDSKAKKEVKKALRFLDSNKDYLERVNAKSLPKKPSADAPYSEQFDREWEKKQLMKERQQAKNFVKQSTDSVAKAYRNAPKWGEFVDKKYGGFENIPRDNKRNIDQETIARDFVNSPYADVKVRKATRKAKKVALQKESAIAQKNQAVSSKLNKIKSATEKLLNKESGSKKLTSSGEAIKRKKREKSAANIRIEQELKGQLNLFNQPKQSAAIAPDIAKKVKRAIPLGSSVKGGKVVKGQKPVSGRVVESGKVGKDGFAKVTVTIPLRAYRTKSGVQQSEPMKGEKIGDYFVSGNTRLGYDVTHLPSGSLLLNTSTLKKELGDSDRKTAKLAAQKLHNAKVKMPSTYNRVKSLNQKDLMDLQKKVFDSIK